MKILLAALYVEGEDSYEAYEDIGICYVAEYLRSKGLQVLLTGESLSRMDFDRIVEFGPDLVGVTLYDRTKPDIKAFLLKIKAMVPNARTCIGGCEATFSHQSIMEEWPFIDYVIRGEGEITSYKLISALQEGRDLADVSGITYRTPKGIIANGDRPLIDIDSLPFPSRDLLVQKKFRFATITGSRGCIRRCAFCCSPKFWRGWRGRQVGQIIDEVEEVQRLHGQSRFMFFDDSLDNPNIVRLTQLVQEMARRQLDIYYIIQMRVEAYNKYTKELLNQMKATGLVNVYIGIESFSQYDLKNVYNKFASVEENHACIEFFKRNDVPYFANFIMFNPYSTIANIRTNIEGLKRHRLASYVRRLVNSYRPYRASTLYDRMSKDGLISKVIDEFHIGYIDDRIGKLSSFMTNEFDPFLQKSRSFNEVTFFSRENLFILAGLKIYFQRSGLIDEAGIVGEVEVQMEAVLSAVSDFNIRWFTALVDLAEAGWSDNAARQVFRDFHVRDHFQDASEALKKWKRLMDVKLLRLNKTYANLLN